MPANAADPVKLRYLASQGGISPHELADELGYFKDTGIELENVGYAQGGPASLFALAAGSVDLGSAATAAVINSIAGGNDFVAAYRVERHQRPGPERLLRARGQPDQIGRRTSPARSIAVNTLGAHLDYTVREALHQNGLPQNAANLIVVPGPQLEQTLRSGQVDIAGVGYWQSTFEGVLKEHGGVRAIFDDTDVLGEIAGGFIVLRRDFIEAHPEAARTLRRAVHPRRRLVAREPGRGTRGTCQASSRSAARTPSLPNTGAASACVPAPRPCRRDLDFWIGVLERDGSLPKGKLKAADLLFDPSANTKSN